MPQEDLEVIFAAAGSAPSAFNYQPWSFLYAHREDDNWNRFLSLLIPFNLSWAQHASVLIFIISETEANGKPIYSSSYDAGAAWACLALQATEMGYYAHGMTGLDLERARIELEIPGTFRIEAAAVVGRRAKADLLPEALRDRERPSGRKPVTEIAFSGSFPVKIPKVASSS